MGSSTKMEFIMKYHLRFILGSLIILISCSALADTLPISHPPTASFTAVINPFDPLVVFVDAKLSSAPNGQIKTYTWFTSDG